MLLVNNVRFCYKYKITQYVLDRQKSLMCPHQILPACPQTQTPVLKTAFNTLIITWLVQTQTPQQEV